MGKSEKSFNLINMLAIPKAILSFSLFLLAIHENGYTQTKCKYIDLNKQPGKGGLNQFWHFTNSQIVSPVN